MGRVAKYKKIKSFDPYSKKNGGRVDLSKVGMWGLGESGRQPKKRSRRAEVLRRNKKRKTNEANEGFDLPPSERDDDFSMKDLDGSVKKQKVETLRAAPSSNTETRIMVGRNVATIPKTDADERAVARVLRVDKQNREVEKKKRLKAQARLEGESKRAYARRTKSETRQIVKQSTVVKNPEKMQKKKEFLNKKKNKNKFKQQESDFVGTEEEMEKDRQLDMPPEPEEVHFTEQVERPPMFKQLPRGAKAKEKKSKEGSKPGMTEAQVKAESTAMELIRRRVQVQYASIKARRKQAGEFHL
ncbi:unnamed protein product [Cylindrotheca closterium]|uniref:Uncharacterized protein n=1 Tax=Cylindrotheca closterium TaxID=2856 RepID=A0AAD2GAD0_9STRA|nr:unnamed protein product [Cylindrotheca closterium]